LSGFWHVAGDVGVAVGAALDDMVDNVVVLFVADLALAAIVLFAIA